MEHHVKFVDDDLLDGRDWVLCDWSEDGVTLYVRRGVREFSDERMERLLEAAWAGYRAMQRVSLPEAV